MVFAILTRDGYKKRGIYGWRERILRGAYRSFTTFCDMKVSIFCGTLGEIESTIVRTKKFKNLARHMVLGIIMTEAPTNEKEKLMKTLLRERKKDELVSFIDMKGTIDTSQASSFLNSPNEAKELLRELENEQYIENTYADYYHVTYEGHKRANEARKKGARWKL